MSDATPPVLDTVRQWAVNWLAGGDVAAAEACLAEGYELQIGAFTLSPRAAYIDGTVSQLARYPGLGVTIHDVLTDGRRAVVRLSEHGPSSRHDGKAAGWRVIALFEFEDAVITRGWAEEDYWARRRQLSAGAPDLLDPPAAAPWATPAHSPEPGVEAAVLDWIAAGAPAVDGVVRDDADLVDSYDWPLETTSATVDVVVVSGRRVGFHAVLHGEKAGESVSLPAAGLIDVASDGSLSGHLITDRLGLPR